MTTTPLLPPCPTPLYYCIDALVEEIWEQCVNLEEKYYTDPSEDITSLFAFNVMKLSLIHI